MSKCYFCRSASIVVLLFLFISQVYSQNEVDSLRNELSRAQGKQKIDVLNELATYLLTITPSESGELAKEALELSKEEDYDRGIVRAWIVNAALMTQQSRYNEATELLNKAMAFSDSKGVGENGAILMTLGSLNTKKGEYSKAMEYHFEGLALARKNNNVKYEVTYLLNIGYIKEVLGELGEAEKYLKEGLSVCETNGFEFKGGQIYINLAVIEYKKQNLGLSIEYNQKALNIFERVGDKSQAAICLQNLGFAYAIQGDLKSALSRYEKSQKLREEMGDQLGVGKVLLRKAGLEDRQGNTSNAFKLVEQSLTIAREINHKALKRDVYLFLYQLYEASRNATNALEYYRAYTDVKDSIANEVNQKRITELTANFELEQLRNKNKLQEQEAQIKDLNLKRGYQLMAALSLVVVLLVLLIVSQRRQMKNRLALTQRDKLILEKETETLEIKLETERERLGLSTKELIVKEEALEALKKQLSAQKVEGGVIDQLIEKLNTSITDDKDWAAFKIYFEVAYPEFFEGLKKLCTETTYGDQRLAALMKINLSNKEVARILNISRDSVVRAKYRLRQKMNFNSTQEMEEMLFRL